MRFDTCEYPFSTVLILYDFRQPGHPSLSDHGRLRIDGIGNCAQERVSWPSIGLPPESAAQFCATIACAQPGYGV